MRMHVLFLVLLAGAAAVSASPSSQGRRRQLSTALTSSTSGTQPINPTTAAIHGALIADMGGNMESAVAPVPAAVPKPVALSETAPTPTQPADDKPAGNLTTPTPAVAQPTNESLTVHTIASGNATGNVSTSDSKPKANKKPRQQRRGVHRSVSQRLAALFTNTKEAAAAVKASLTSLTQSNTSNGQSNNGKYSQGAQEKANRRGRSWGGGGGYYRPWGVYRPYNSYRRSGNDWYGNTYSVAGWGGRGVCAHAERAHACSYGRKLLRMRV